MHRRFICPHCHSPIDPLAMDAARSAGMDYRVCPVCDGAVPLISPDPVVELEPPAGRSRAHEPAPILEGMAT